MVIRTYWIDTPQMFARLQVKHIQTVTRISALEGIQILCPVAGMIQNRMLYAYLL